MILLPGPAVLVIPLGLSILGLEFAWALRWLRQVKSKFTDGQEMAGSFFGRGRKSKPKE